MYVQRACFAVIFAPHLVKQLVARKHIAGIGNQQVQQFVLLGRKGSNLSADGNKVLVVVHCDVLVGNNGAPVCGRTQLCLYSGDKFQHSEGLAKVVVGTEI